MEFFELISETIFSEFVYGLFRIIGACFRFLFLRRYKFREILSQDWNGLGGIIGCFNNSQFYNLVC